MTQDDKKSNDKKTDDEITTIVNEIIEAAPECTITEDTTEDLTEESQAFQAIDAKGRTFDKDLHWVNDDGIPMLNKNGTLKTKRKKRKKGGAQENNSAKGMTIEHTGKLLAQYTVAISVGVFGQEFLPQKIMK
jgi:hypothetical protein